MALEMAVGAWDRTSFQLGKGQENANGIGIRIGILIRMQIGNGKHTAMLLIGMVP